MQQHQRAYFESVWVHKISPIERKCTMISLMLSTEKAEGKMKCFQVYNGKPTREWVIKENNSSPTVNNEALLINSMEDSHEHREVMGRDVTSAFLQVNLPEKEGSEQVCMKIVGELVEYLVEIAPETYSKDIAMEKNKKVLYIVFLKVIYGILEAPLLWYHEILSKLKGIGFKFHPYDACVCNRIVNGKQHMVRFHVDDILSSHVEKR